MNLGLNLRFIILYLHSLPEDFCVSVGIDLFVPEVEGQFIPFASLWHDPAVFTVDAFNLS